jgi:hypothetical protein
MKLTELRNIERSAEKYLSQISRSAVMSVCGVLVCAGALGAMAVLRDYQDVSAQSSCTGIVETYANYNDLFLTLVQGCTQFNMSEFWNRLTGFTDPNLAIDAFEERQDLVPGQDGNLYLIPKGGNRIEIKIPITASGFIRIRNRDGIYIEFTQDELALMANEVARQNSETMGVSAPDETSVVQKESDNLDSVNPPELSDGGDTNDNSRSVEVDWVSLLDNPAIGFPILCLLPLASVWMVVVGIKRVVRWLGRADNPQVASTPIGQKTQSYEESAQGEAESWVDEHSFEPERPLASSTSYSERRALPNTGIGMGETSTNDSKAVGFTLQDMMRQAADAKHQAAMGDYDVDADGYEFIE